MNRRILFSAVAAIACFTASADTEGWDNINLSRKNLPPQRVIWKGDVSKAKMELRDGAEGSMQVVGTGSDAQLEIVKKNSEGTILVTFPPFAVAMDEHMRV